MNWTKKALEQVADFCLGKMLDQKKNKGDLRPYLANVNVRWGEFTLDNLREMRFEHDELERFGLKYGDIVMCEGGEPGRCAIWKNQVPGMMIQKALHRIRPRECLDYRFLYYVFLHYGQTGRFARLFTGATISHLPREKLALLELNIPPIHTQRAISAILSAYDDLIENNTRRIRILEEMAQTIYREWFVHFRFPGHQKVRMVDSPLGKIPQGWENRLIPEVIEINPKCRFERADTRKFVPMACLSCNSMLIDENLMEDRSAANGSKFQNGDTLFARITPCLENGKTGYVSFLPTPSDVAIGSTEFIVLRSRSLCSEFVYLLARTEAFRNHAIKSMSGATGRQRVQEACFGQLSIAAAPQSVIAAFREIVKPMFEITYTLAKKNRILRTTRDLLLPKLISGEVDVSSIKVSGDEI